MIHRKRGLLYPLLPSRSYADARIEISVSLWGRSGWWSRSYADARIEISCNDGTVQRRSIAFLCGRADWNLLICCQYRNWESRSYADARIEMTRNADAGTLPRIAFLCGRADWNFLIEILLTTRARRRCCIAFLCGRADWNDKRICFYTSKLDRVPMRTRGLKSCRRSEGRFGLMSCSLRSAWIEIGWAWAARWSSVALLAERVD